MGPNLDWSAEDQSRLMELMLVNIENGCPWVWRKSALEKGPFCPLGVTYQ